MGTLSRSKADSSKLEGSRTLAGTRSGLEYRNCCQSRLSDFRTASIAPHTDQTIHTQLLFYREGRNCSGSCTAQTDLSTRRYLPKLLTVEPGRFRRCWC